ncbi:MAG: GTPase HflX [Parachlamydiales bacterium]|nr:GTPase HflX [Parachlamydiales bacterium]
MVIDESQNLITPRLLDLDTDTKALLIGTYTSGKDKHICFEHLDELERLADTYGLKTFHKLSCPIKKVESATYLGSGKVEEIKTYINENDIDIVIFDIDIAPHQQRNLEKIFQKTVIDRTELILGVFAIHARTKEAKLQVKLAQAKYEFPRLKRMWTHLSRQRTGGAKGGFLKGEGEKQIEIDKQILKTKISALEKQIDDLKKHRDILRKKRAKTSIPTFAIVGYTNAGKSTLMNALTDAKVLVEDKLFATLDTTTRKYVLPNSQEILLVDTVGFIRKLPHNLIAAFKSTLEEVIYSDFLIHLIDVSSPSCIDEAKASLEVLKELNALEIPVITCLNKIDLLKDRSILNYFRINFKKTVEISALTKQGFDDLINKFVQEISDMRKIVKLKIPQSYYKIVSELIKEGRVISLDYEENDVLLEIEIPKTLLRKVSDFQIS